MPYWSSEQLRSIAQCATMLSVWRTFEFMPPELTNKLGNFGMVVYVWRTIRGAPIGGSRRHGWRDSPVGFDLRRWRRGIGREVVTSGRFRVALRWGKEKERNMGTLGRGSVDEDEKCLVKDLNEAEGYVTWIARSVFWGSERGLLSGIIIYPTRVHLAYVIFASTSAMPSSPSKLCPFQSRQARNMYPQQVVLRSNINIIMSAIVCQCRRRRLCCMLHVQLINVPPCLCMVVYMT